MIMSAKSKNDAAHILIVMHDFPAGGTERIIIRLANRWAASGRRVTILCGCEDGPARFGVSDAVVVMRTPKPIRRGFLSRRLLGRAVARLLPTLGADIVVAPGNFHLAVLHAIGRSPIPLVCKLSNTLSRYDSRPLRAVLFGYKLRRLVANVDGVVAMSPTLADEARYILPKVPVYVVAQPNVADDAILAQPRTAAIATRILCAGRLVAQKNLSLALEAFSRLDRPTAMLTVAGDGPERAMLEALAHNLGIRRRVNFCGHVSDIGPLLDEAELLLSTSSFEGYPGVIIEALAKGVPIVSTPSSPALADIFVDPSFGRVVAQDAGVLASAMSEVMSNPRPDPKALAVFMDRHRVGRSAAAWLKMLDRVVSRHSSAEPHTWRATYPANLHMMPAVAEDDIGNENHFRQKPEGSASMLCPQVV